MTKKDYELIARIVKTNVEASKRLNAEGQQLAIDLANSFANDLVLTNPLFDRDRFLKACGVIE